MHLTTLVGLLEHDLSDGPNASAREELARLYTERGHHLEAAKQRRVARSTAERAAVREPALAPK